MGDGGQEATRLDRGTFPFGLRLVRFGTEDSFPNHRHVITRCTLPI